MLVMVQLQICSAEQVSQKTIKQLAYEFHKTSDSHQKGRIAGEILKMKPKIPDEIESLFKIGRSMKEINEEASFYYFYGIKIEEGDKHLEGVLLKGLEDKERGVRIASINNLGTLKSKSAAPKLRDIIEDFNSYTYKAVNLVDRRKASKMLAEPAAAALALASIKDTKAIPILVKRSDDLDGFGAMALAKMGKIAFPYLLEMARKETDRQNAYAHRALADIRDKEAKRDLINAVKAERDRDVRSRLISALCTHMFDDEVLNAFTELYEKERDGEFILAMESEKAIPLLTRIFLTEQEYHIRECAGIVLRNINDPKTIPIFEKALKDRDKKVQLFARAALKRMTGRDYGQD